MKKELKTVLKRILAFQSLILCLGASAFSGAAFSGTDFSEAVCSGAVFSKAAFWGGAFTGAAVSAEELLSDGEDLTVSFPQSGEPENGEDRVKDSVIAPEGAAGAETVAGTDAAEGSGAVPGSDAAENSSTVPGADAALLPDAADGLEAQSDASAGSAYAGEVISGEDFMPDAVPLVSAGDEDTGLDPNTVILYRLYNPNSGEHFFTANKNERNHLAAIGWKYEGIAWVSPSSGGTPVYRLYNPKKGFEEHHYTQDKNEIRVLTTSGWKLEGAAWLSDNNKTVPVYRLFDRMAKSSASSHHYTTDANENAVLGTRNWRQEGTGWYALKKGQDIRLSDDPVPVPDSLNAIIRNGLPSDNGQWAVYVEDLKNGGRTSVGSARMESASLIKLFIMGAVYERYDALSAVYSKGALDSNLRSMITVSDNDAANTLTAWLGNGDTGAGMRAVNAFCSAHGYKDTSMGRLLLHPATYGDNYTSVDDCGRFLREIYLITEGKRSGTLSHAGEMLSLLKQQQLTYKLPALLPAGVVTANKTGELDTVQNDVGIIYGVRNDLIICIMSRNVGYPGYAQRTISSLARRIYDFYN